MVDLSMELLTLALASLMDESIRVRNLSGSSALHSSILLSFSLVRKLPYLEYCLLIDSVNGLSSMFLAHRLARMPTMETSKQVRSDLDVSV